MNALTTAAVPTFGDLLRRLRKRAGMTQDDLAAATGYSRPLIGALEGNRRLPNVDLVMQEYVPALGLQEEPHLARQLVELAARARGEKPPPALILKPEQEVVATPASEAPPRLPVPLTGIRGRDAEISHLCDRLLGPHGRLLTLIGPPGVGKTRLAQAVGAQIEAVYRDGALFVPLALVSDAALVAPTLLSALGVHGAAGVPPQTRLVQHLRRKEMLLVLDNFEQLLTAPSVAVELLAGLLAECPGLHILVTSRERLHLRGEQRYVVPPLPLVAAADLFVERCQALDPGFALTLATRATVEAICQQVDCLPLAIELCAAQIDLLSPAQVLAHLQDRRLELLVDGARDLPPRQRTLRKAIAHSFDLLDDEERKLFRSLGILVGGGDLEAIEAVNECDQMSSEPPLLSTLHALIGKSLVRAEKLPGGATRYLLLETIREFALEQARAEGEEDRLRQRHYEAYLRLFRAGDRPLRGPEGTAGIARLEAEQGNLRAALQWAVDGGRYADAAWLLLAAWWFLFLVGHWQEGGRWIERVLAQREALPTEVRVATLLNLYSVSRASAGFQYADELTTLLASCSDPQLHAGRWRFVAGYSAGLPAASAAWDQGIAWGRAARERSALGPDYGVAGDVEFVLADTLWAAAESLIELGDFSHAAPLLAEAADLVRTRGNLYEMADSLGAWGRLALLQGDLQKAEALLCEGVSLARSFNYQVNLGNYQPLLGLVTLYRGDSAEARRLLAEGMRLCLDLNDKYFLARACTFLAETALSEGAVDEADQWLARSLAYPEEPRWSRIFLVERLFVEARLGAAQGAYLRAAVLLGRAERLRLQAGYEPAGPVAERTAAAMDEVRRALDPAVFAEAFASTACPPVASSLRQNSA